MNEVRANHTATLLNSGKVLVTGGYPSTGTAEIYDPSTGVWRYTAHPMQASRHYHTATLLTDGRVLLIGGNSVASVPQVSAEVFDPVTEQFTLVRPPNFTHGLQPAVLLNDGRVLIIGGGMESELYDPALDTWTVVAAISPVNREFPAVKLINGNVLSLGGDISNPGCCPSTSINRYDPVSNTVTLMASMLEPRVDHTATLLPSGQIVIVGGTYQSTNSTEVYDPASPPNGQSQFGALLNDARRHHVATLLPNGDLLVTGGSGASGVYLSSAEVRDHVSGSWTLSEPMSIPRNAHAAALLPSGQVLVTGGYSSPTALGYVASAEVWGAATGIIHVTTNRGAATFTLAGPATYSGGGTDFTQPNALVGNYTITYDAVAGYITPPQQTGTLSSATPLSFTGTYQKPSLFLSTGKISFTYQKGDKTPVATQNVALATNGPEVDFTLAVVADGPWLTLTPSSTKTPANLTAAVIPGNLQPGVYRATITITAANAVSSPQRIDVQLTIQAGKSPLSSRKLVVALFIGAAVSGAPTDPNIGDGLKQLLTEVTDPQHPAYIPELVGKTFSHLDFNNAVGFVSSNLRGPEDRLVLIGHSFGGDTARQMAAYLSQGVFAGSQTPIRVNSLVMIDPIDPEPIILGPIGNAGVLGTFNQAFTTKARPNGVNLVLGFFQRVGRWDLNCSAIDYFSLCGYRIQDADLEFQYDVAHTSIDNDTRVHQNIISMLSSIVP